VPTPTNISMLYVPAAQALRCLSVSQWAQKHLRGINALPLLEGCYVLVPAKVRAPLGVLLPAVERR
jgi:hypothetical protein